MSLIKDYIIENITTKSAAEIAIDLNLSEDNVRMRIAKSNLQQYPTGTKLYKTSESLDIHVYTYDRKEGNKHIILARNGVQHALSDQMLSEYNFSRRMVLTELEEVLRGKIERVHGQMKDMAIKFNPIQPFDRVFVTHGGNTIKEVHKYDPNSGRYIESYPSFTYAAQANGGTAKSGSNITRVCKGGRPLAYGFKWSYEKRNFY